MLVFTLHGEFYAEKYSKVLLWNAWNVLMRMHRKKRKYDTFLTLKEGTIKSLPEPNYLMPYTIKHSKGKTFAVHQQCSLLRENFHSLPTTTYFSVLITRQENFRC